MVQVCALLLALAVPSLLTASDTSALPASFYRDDVPRANGSVALIGDSLTYAHWSGLPAEFVAERWGPFQLEARSGRFTTTTTESATSGLEAVRRVREGGFEPAVWIIALGTNDLAITYETPGATAALIDTMMTEIGSGRRVVWVNVYKQFSVTKARAFNDELQSATARHPGLVIVDWFTVAAAHPEWMQDDGVHMNMTGSVARNQFVARAALASATPPLRCDPPPTSAAPDLKAAKFELAASATLPAVRLCRR